MSPVSTTPLVEAIGGWCSVRGRFYREVDAARSRTALAGSQAPGRYSRATQPTLYLSASLEGVAAAMVARSGSATMPRAVVSFNVAAGKIFDLRRTDRLSRAGLNTSEVFSD